MAKKPFRFRAVHEKTRWRIASHETFKNATTSGNRSAKALFDHKNEVIKYNEHGEPLYVVIWNADDEAADGVIVKKSKVSGELDYSSPVPRLIIERWNEKSGNPDNVTLEAYFVANDTFAPKEPENQSVENPIDEQTYSSIKSRRGQAKFRQMLLSAFNDACCISKSEVTAVLEAAHIIPHTEETNYAITNGLLLRADIHTLYDLNLIGIDENGLVHISSSLKNTEYSQYRDLNISEEIPELMAANLRERFELFKTNNS
jgi:hypothetical protein